MIDWRGDRVGSALLGENPSSALCRSSMPAGKARMMRVSHDYHRRGALAYLLLQRAQAQIYCRGEATTGSNPSPQVEQVMTQSLTHPRTACTGWSTAAHPTGEHADSTDNKPRPPAAPTQGRLIPDELADLTT